jgi:hypothetical protein
MDCIKIGTGTSMYTCGACHNPNIILGTDMTFNANKNTNAKLLQLFTIFKRF